MSVRDLESNWAYRVIAVLAWNLKDGLDCRCRKGGRGTQGGKIEFGRYLKHLDVIAIPQTQCRREECISPDTVID